MRTMRSPLSARRKKRFRNPTFIGLTRVSRVNTILRRSPAFYNGGSLLVLFNHIAVTSLHKKMIFSNTVHQPYWFQLYTISTILHFVPCCTLQHIALCTTLNFKPHHTMKNIVHYTMLRFSWSCTLQHVALCDMLYFSPHCTMQNVAHSTM